MTIFFNFELTTSELNILIQSLREGDFKALSRAISLVENESAGYEEILQSFDSNSRNRVVGITGPPGSGKSTLVNALIGYLLTQEHYRIGVIAVDPTSPFTQGSLLGDRLRMSEHFNNPRVFIRSLATRGSLGGLSDKIIEVIDVMKTSGFDWIFVETVGVGQSEVEVVAIADTTLVVLQPGLGDEVQTIKSGIMEIADIFVVNKSDHEGAEAFISSLELMIHTHYQGEVLPPVVRTIAVTGVGIPELIVKIGEHQTLSFNQKKISVLTEKAYRLISTKRMKDVDRTLLEKEISNLVKKEDFNLYKFVKSKV